jgi:hypothetical protein
VPRSRRHRAPSWAARLFLAAAYVLAALFTWQGALIEVADVHASALVSCDEGEGGDADHEKDCGFNCHCCLRCAHQGVPAIPALAADAAPVRVLDFIDLSDLHEADAMASADSSPPLKVPKLLA